MLMTLSAMTPAGHPLDAHTHNVLSIAWGPTGRYLASAGAIADGDNSHGVALWDREQISSFAHIIYELKNPDPKFALSADGSSWICGSCDDRIVWDGRPVDLPAGVDAGHASAAAMDPDGKEAAVAVPGKIVVIRRSGANFNVELRESPSASVHAMAYVNGALYAEDEKLSAWNVSGRGAVKTATAAPFDSTGCFDGSQAGPYFTSEVFDRAGMARLTLTDLNSGVVKEFPLPSDADTCAALTFSPEAMIAVRTSANYRPFLAVSVDSGSPVRRISNPLRQSAGLPTVLRNAHLSRDGRRLVASSDNSGLAVFNLAADRLIGAIDLSEVRHVALAASGKVALVEGAGRILSVDLDPASWQRKAQQLVSQ
jgi:WD40 repeat protein